MRRRRPKYFWEVLRSVFATYLLPDWDTLHRALVFGCRALVPVPLNDTS